jgi:peptidoglycan L-alanyl-D-glutamate endopeptidase CwlK
MASRNIDDLVLELQKLYWKFSFAMAKVGLTFMVTCTERSQEEQDELYAQGRTKPGRKVTWTRKSRHIRGEAFDIAIVKGGKPCWDPKVDVNNDDIPDYDQAGKIGESVGLAWGGLFGTPDRPHFELKRKEA